MRAAPTDRRSPTASSAASRAARLRAVHPMLWAAFAALATGAVLCVIGWYGISGERFAERQLPYIASCTVPGAALIVAGAVLLAHGRGALAAARVEELYGLLVAVEGQNPLGARAERAAAPVATSSQAARSRPTSAPRSARSFMRRRIVPFPLSPPSPPLLRRTTALKGTYREKSGYAGQTSIAPPLHRCRSPGSRRHRARGAAHASVLHTDEASAGEPVPAPQAPHRGVRPRGGHAHRGWVAEHGRGDRTRTCDLLLPKQAR